MKTPLTKDEYIRQFQENMPYDNREKKELNEYLAQQFEQLNQLTSIISPDNFWENFPRILGIDAKLTLIAELIHYDYNQLPIKEILRLAETDYRVSFKELYGNELLAKNKYSMVCNVV